MTDRDRFEIGMQRLAATFDKSPTQDLLDSYWAALTDLTDAEVADAITAAIKSERWFPRPRALRALALERRMSQGPAPSPYPVSETGCAICGAEATLVTMTAPTGEMIQRLTITHDRAGHGLAPKRPQ